MSTDCYNVGVDVGPAKFIECSNPQNVAEQR